MNKTKTRNLILLSIIVLMVIILLGILVGRYFQNRTVFESRPLVLIHDPVGDSTYQVGESIMVHATAREDQGLARIELWANGQLIESLDAEDPPPTNLVLAAAWYPTYTGIQQLVVRAISADNVAGQSSINIFASESGEDQTGRHLVEEGDTLESIAAEYGSSADELSELNPGIDPGGINPGDEVIVPDDEPLSDDPPAGDGGEAPTFAGDQPLLGYIEGIFGFSPAANEGVALRLEIPRMRTTTAFDSLHCYVSLADSLPQWYPDWDQDQATDESFAPMTDGWWNTEDSLTGEAAPVIVWPGDQSLPMSVLCVGLTGGGTDAIDLGQVDVNIPPERWDGIRQPFESDGEGGHLSFEIRVTRLEGTPGYTPKSPDPLMPIPYNVRLSEEEGLIEWDFDPNPDDPINGFQVHLNGNLQWTEGADARSSNLPPEWFHPPCATIYNFEIYAFIIDYPEGRESLPGSVLLEQPREGCIKQVQVTFLSLETFNLGGDGRFEDRHGDVGPAYGRFYANESRVDFDHGHEGPGLDMPNGLSHDSMYDLTVAAADISWHFAGPNTVVTEVPTGGTMRVGFGIMDRDTGRCRDSDDRGCDDIICRGVHAPIRDQYGQLDGVHTETITTENGRCRLTFEYRLTDDSPTGERGTWGEPLPWLEVAALDVYSDPENTIVEVENTGTASWPGRTLTIELQTRDGDSLGHFPFEDVNLPVGETQIFRIPTDSTGALIDVCVLLDSQDEVLELYERSGALIHTPVCTRLPDLDINAVRYREGSPPMIQIDFVNAGSGPVSNWPLDINIQLPDGQYLFENYRLPGFVLAAGVSSTVEIPVLEASTRRSMFDGYTVTLNPEAAFPEITLENNSFTVGAGTEISATWYGINAPYGMRNISEFHVDIYILQGSERTQHIVDWSETQDIDWGSCFDPRYCVLLFYSDYWTSRYEIYGDESLQLVMSITNPGSLTESFTFDRIYEAPSWGAGGDAPGGGCSNWPRRDDVGRHSFIVTAPGGNQWWTRVDICRDNFAE